MAESSDAHVEVAKRLLAHEGAGVAQAPDNAEAAGRVYEALFLTLTPIIGAAGAHGLLLRSIKLATVECLGLEKLVVPAEPSDSDPKVAGYLVTCLRELEPDASAEAAACLFAVLLRLLTNFIGEPLVWQILQKAFPKIARTQPKETM